MTAKYVINRLVFVVVVIWSATTINFFLPRISGQDPIRERIAKQMSGGSGAYQQGGAAEEIIKEYNRQFGLDKPLWLQYLNYLGNLVRFDFGKSIPNYPTQVSTIIGAGLPWTVGLLGVTTLLSVVIGSLFGALVAWKRSVAWLQFLAGPLMALSAIPYYLLGLILLFLFAYGLRWFPGNGGYSFTAVPNWSWTFAWDVVQHLVLPALSVILSAVGFWAVGMRGNMVTVEGEDFMTLAEAKGLKPTTLFFRYAFRNTLLPQVTSLALALGYVLSGSILVDVVFGLPGIGSTLFEAIKGVDYPVIQGIVFTIILSLTVSILILDLTLPILDPRIQYGEA
jgi:peptide/nickel transport system permease protein